MYEIEDECKGEDHKSMKWEEIRVPIPKLVLKSDSDEEKREIYEYLRSMDEKQCKAYLIAYHHLGTSFNVCKSNGFKEWIKQKNLK